MNAVVNAFIEGKKLNLSSKKCHRIHIKNKKTRNELKCPEVKIHNGKMNDAIQEKYLGDLINTSGTCTKTIEERRSKAFGIVNEIIAILDEIPLGRYKMEIGLKQLLRSLVKGHAKTPFEFLYLEAGAT